MKEHKTSYLIDLIGRAQLGDEEAFTELYNHSFVPVYRYIYFRVKNKIEAEDLAQSVFLKVFASLHRFEDRGTSPLAYFFTIAKNEVMSHWRKKKDVLLDNPDVFFAHIASERAHPQQELERSEADAEILQSLSQLTKEQQEVLVMRFIGELSNKEISEIIGKREDAVRQIQSRGLRTLRKYLTNEQS